MDKFYFVILGDQDNSIGNEMITGLLWYRKRSEIKDIVAEIKARPIQKQ